jgi:protease I
LKSIAIRDGLLHQVIGAKKNMANILIILPQTDFDPTEVAVPWKAWTLAGHDVDFATQTGAAAMCDPVTLSGLGLPLFARSLAAKPENRALYEEMVKDDAYHSPLSWEQVKISDFDAVHFPGGHAPGMRPYIESEEVQRIGREAFAVSKPVSAICHGVLPLAQAGLLKGRKTTALTAKMEGLAVLLTKAKLGDHYRTYPESVEDEVKRLLMLPTDFLTGPLFPRFATQSRPGVGFVVQDGNYISARWPGDAWTLATRMLKLLASI